jgi:hypothetical protein
VQQNSGSCSFFFFRPQVDFVTDVDGAVMVRDLFLLEHIASSFPAFQEKSWLCNALEHRNKSVSRMSRNELREDHVAYIRSAHAADFKLISTCQTAA